MILVQPGVGLKTRRVLEYMRINRNIVYIVVGFAGAAASLYLARPDRPRGLVADEPVRHLGKLRQNQTVPIEFQLVNNTDHTIEIINVIKSCTCTEASISTRTLVPGGATSLTGAWTTGISRGRFASTVSVVYKTSEGDQSSLNLTLEADVSPDYEYSPSQLIFHKSSDTRQILAIAPVEMADVAVVTAYTDHNAFAARCLGEGRVEVTFDPLRWPPEGAPAEVRVQTTSPNQEWIRVAIGVE